MAIVGNLSALRPLAGVHTDVNVNLGDTATVADIKARHQENLTEIKNVGNELQQYMGGQKAIGKTADSDSKHVLDLLRRLDEARAKEAGLAELVKSRMGNSSNPTSTQFNGSLDNPFGGAQGNVNQAQEAKDLATLNTEFQGASKGFNYGGLNFTAAQTATSLSNGLNNQSVTASNLNITVDAVKNSQQAQIKELVALYQNDPVNAQIQVGYVDKFARAVEAGFTNPKEQLAAHSLYAEVLSQGIDPSKQVQLLYTMADKGFRSQLVEGNLETSAKILKTAIDPQGLTISDTELRSEYLDALKNDAANPNNKSVEITQLYEYLQSRKQALGATAPNATKEQVQNYQNEADAVKNLFNKDANFRAAFADVSTPTIGNNASKPNFARLHAGVGYLKQAFASKLYIDGNGSEKDKIAHKTAMWLNDSRISTRIESGDAKALQEVQNALDSLVKDKGHWYTLNSTWDEYALEGDRNDANSVNAAIEDADIEGDYKPANK